MEAADGTTGASPMNNTRNAPAPAHMGILTTSALHKNRPHHTGGITAGMHSKQTYVASNYSLVGDTRDQGKYCWFTSEAMRIGNWAPTQSSGIMAEIDLLGEAARTYSWMHTVSCIACGPNIAVSGLRMHISESKATVRKHCRRARTGQDDTASSLQTEYEY